MLNCKHISCKLGVILKLIIILSPIELRAEQKSNNNDNVEIYISSGEWPPFIGSDLPNYGFVGDIITRAFAEECYKVKFEFLPWARAYAETKRGKYDATAIWMHSAEREVDFFIACLLVKKNLSSFIVLKNRFIGKR